MIQINDDENVPEKCFIEQAFALLNEREHSILWKISNSADLVSNQLNDNTVPIEVQHFTVDSSKCFMDPFDNNITSNRERFESTSSEGVGNEDSNSSNSNSHNLDISTTAKSNAVKNYYFYQGNYR